MAVIRPFSGLRYSADAGPITALTAPPYDVISPAEREEFAVRSPYNIVHLTLPEPHADDRSKFVKYARSAAQLAEWRRENILVPEAEPVIYRYTQEFKIGPETFSRTAVVALLKVEPYSAGVVLPHEETFPKHKEDRLRILEATHAHLECIYGLYEDPAGELLTTIRTAATGPAVQLTTENGVDQKFEPIVSPDAIADLVRLFADKKIWIADGHHRYETALAFRESIGPQDHPVAEDYMMIALSSMSDPGLVLLPTHRIINHWKYDRLGALARLEPYFDVEETHSSRLMEDMHKEMDRRTFGLTFEGSVGYLLRAKDDAELLKLVPGEMSDNLRSLDVTILHRLIFERLLELPNVDMVSYTRDWHESVRKVNEGAAAAFLMRPPTVDDMRLIAMGGEKMPQKSTYYYPKILSGLVLWSLNDF
jgi:uncharacterized protein (DUF1015 family)